MRLLKKLLLVLTPLGAAAFVAGGGTFSSFAELVAWRRPARATTAAASRNDGAGLYRTKKILLLMMLIGVVAYFAGNGTFASFSAEVSNSGSSIASGTLTLENQSSTTCWSYQGTTNVNPNCGSVLTLANLAPGVFGGLNSLGNFISGSSQVTLTNGGSLDAAKFYVYAPSVTATVNGTFNDTPTPGSANVNGTLAQGATSIPITSTLSNALSLGTQVTVTNGSTSETTTLTADATTAATSLSVTALAHSYTGTVTVKYPLAFSMTVTPLTAAIAQGQKIVVTSSSPAHTDTFQTSQAAAIGATTLNLAAPLSPPSYNAYGTTTPASTVASVDCYDQRTTSSPVSGSPNVGTDITSFNTLANNPFCGALLMSIQEVDSNSQTYCWSGSNAAPEMAIGMCNAPVSTALSSALSTGGAITSLPLGSLNGNIRGGDTLTITSGSHSQTFTVPADDTVASGGTLAGATSLPLASALSLVSPATSLPSGTAITVGNGATQDTVTTTATVSNGATSIPVTAMTHTHNAGEAVTYTSGGHDYFYSSSNTSVTVASQTPNFAYPTTSTVVDTTELNNLNSDQTDTLSNFDTLHPSTGEIPLYPVTGNGTDDTAAPVWLGHGASRTFYVSVYLPKPSGSNQNLLQGLSSTFGLTWHIDQL